MQLVDTIVEHILVRLSIVYFFPFDMSQAEGEQEESEIEERRSPQTRWRGKEIKRKKKVLNFG